MSGAYYNEIDPYAAQWLRNVNGYSGLLERLRAYGNAINREAAAAFIAAADEALTTTHED